MGPKVKGLSILVAMLAAGLLPAADPRLARRVVDQTGREVNVPEHPQRLVSLAPSITETVFALGLGDRLVGDTDYCDYPPEAKLKPHVGSTLNPSVERIASLSPDLVLGTPEANRRETADQLERLGIPLYGVTAHSVEETLRSVADLGQVLGREREARALVEGLQARVRVVEQRVQGLPRPRVLYVVWYRPLITAGRNSFISDAIRRAGGISVADDLPGEWPRMSLEEVVRRDPEVILFPEAESFSPPIDEFSRQPGWKEVSAIRDHRMYLIPATINRTSPSLIDALEKVAEALHPASVGTAKREGNQ